MGHRNRDRAEEESLLYRVKVGGSLPASRRGWLDAESVQPSGSNTVIHLRVLDQSDLYGRLRKIHDLNLQLISVDRLEG